jgi:hypothetical protein
MANVLFNVVNGCRQRSVVPAIGYPLSPSLSAGGPLSTLQEVVPGMNLENFIVRKHQHAVETKPGRTWTTTPATKLTLGL